MNLFTLIILILLQLLGGIIYLILSIKFKNAKYKLDDILIVILLWELCIFVSILEKIVYMITILIKKFNLVVYNLLCKMFDKKVMDDTFYRKP